MAELVKSGGDGVRILRGDPSASRSLWRRGLRITSGSRGQIPLDLKDDLVVLWVKASSLAD